METKTKTRKVISKRLEKPTVTQTLKRDLDEKTKDVTLQRVIIRRKLKYIYPKGCITPLGRKAHRAKVRAQLEKLTANITRVKGAEKAKAKAILAEYEKLHLV